MDTTEPVARSYLSWMLSALGAYAFLIPVAALLSFAMILLLVIRGRGSMAAAALILLTPIPFLVACYGALSGLISSTQIIELSGVNVKPAEWGGIISKTAAVPMFGMLMSLPNLMAAAIGAFAQALTPPKPTDNKNK